MTDFIDEIGQYLEAQNFGDLGVDIFESDIPADVDSAIALHQTLGVQPNTDVPIGNPSFQVFVRDTTYLAAKTRFESLKTLLHNKYNFSFVTGGNYFYYCRLITDGGHIGKDEVGRDMFSMNFECRKRDAN